MNNCIFCKISTGEISAEKVYEDDQVVACLLYTSPSPRDSL